MKLAADFSIEGFFIRVEKIERNQGQNDGDGSQNRLERGAKEEIEAQAESFFPVRDSVERVQ